MIFIVILLLSSVNGESIKKCCPIDEVISTDNYDENSISSNELFNCVPSNFTKNNSEFSNLKFVGYNTLVDSESHWPSCGDQPLSFKRLIGFTKVSQSASCIDLMDGSYFIFTCDEKMDTANDFAEIMKLKKCCPPEMSYDIFQRKCVANESDFSELLHNKISFFEHEVLKCKESEALVEYHSLVHGIKIRKSSLILLNTRPSGPDVIENSFCIEATSNSDVEMPPGMTEEHFDKRSRSKFIAKTCRDSSICEEIPCLQKCCPHGERFFHNGTKTICVPYHIDVDIKFHGFNKDQSYLEPPAFEPSGEFSLYLFCSRFV
jgi:hypothetical protein